MPAQLIVATLMSPILLWLILKNGSLWPCIACYIVNNSIGVAPGLASTAGPFPGIPTTPGGSNTGTGWGLRQLRKITCLAQ